MSLIDAVRRIRRALAHEARTLRGAFYRRIALDPADERSVVREFHRLYFDARAFNMTWRNTYFLGHAVLKCPLDLWLYQEMLHAVRPAVIVETGTAFGGSALYLASICDLLGTGRVVTVDVVERPGAPAHPRITYVIGSSIDPDVVAGVRSEVGASAPVMVLLDSDHRRDHVLAELEAYAPLVSRGSYLVVEDTNLNGHPVEPDHGPGPMEAVEAFLARHPEFAHDASLDKFLLTFNPRGFLRRLR
ncbi:MAG: CmcI family methyltransferase [Acidobacteria bacterium]|nr:CmcI family methyltransferase [Acidobacteriota bacterium]